MKKNLRIGVLIALALALVATLGSCEIFGIEGPTYLGVIWDGTTLYYDWDLPYPFNDSWDYGTYYEIEPGSYNFSYSIDDPDPSALSDWYTLNIEADAGSFPFQEGAETAFILDITFTGPYLYYGNNVPAAKTIQPDGSWSSTVSSGGKTITLSYKANAIQSPEPSGAVNSKTK